MHLPAGQALEFHVVFSTNTIVCCYHQQRYEERLWSRFLASFPHHISPSFHSANKLLHLWIFFFRMNSADISSIFWLWLTLCGWCLMKAVCCFEAPAENLYMHSISSPYPVGYTCY